MAVGGVSNSPSLPANQPAADAGGDKFKSREEINSFLQSDSTIKDLRYMMAGTSGDKPGADQKVANSSFVKTFESNMQKALDKLGPNATKEQVTKAANNEAYKQMLFKNVVEKAASRVMARVKEMNADTFG